jgi:diguanylate cyclase (GGDEF)-like protein
MTRWSAVTRLRLVSLALVFASLVAISTVALLDHRRQAAAEKEALDLARLVALEQRQLIVAARDVLSAVAQLPAAYRASQRGDCHRALARLLKEHPQYSNFGVITPTGDLICSATPLIQPVNLADRSCFRDAIAAQGFAIGDYRLDLGTGTSSLTFGYPVFRKGALEGVACAVLSARALVPPGAQARLSADAPLVVINERGEVMTHHSGEVTTASPDPRLVRALLAQGGEGMAEIARFDGSRRRYGFSPLYETAAGTVYVGIGVPESIATGTPFTRHLVLVLALAFFVLATVWLATDRSMARRLHPLVEALRRLGLPDHTAATLMPSSPAQHDLQRVNRALAARCALHRALVHARDEQALLREASLALADAGGYAHVAVVCAGTGARTGAHVVAQCGLGDDLLPRDLGRLPGPVAAVLSNGRHLVTDDLMALLDQATAPRGLRRAVVLPLHGADGVLGAMVVLASQADAFGVTELELLADSARDLARRIGALRRKQRDPLTGLPNVQRFEARMREAIEDSGRPLALLLMDLDRFRDINDAFGFEHGDRVLKAVGERTRDAVPADTFVGRMHGDEFAVLLPHAGQDEAQAAAVHLLAALEPAFALEGVAIDMHASIGIALYPAHGRTVDELMRHADIAARHAKRMESGYAFYAREHDRPTRFALASALHRAIKNDELVLHFQPKIDAKSGSVTGAETLVRWQRPGHGLIFPGDFIALAERSGLIRPLTDWVLEACLRQCVDWHRRGFGLPIAVNFSARTLLDPRLADHMRSLFIEHGASPDWLQLELTESVLMERRQGDMDVLSQLHDLGVSLFIDDFGMGYSSFNYLKKLPVDAIKIDKSFITEMLTDADSAYIVRAMIQLAHGLDMQTVAEGVDTQAAWNRLRAIGCDAIQGFYVSEPLPAQQFEAWLAQHRVVEG